MAIKNYAHWTYVESPFGWLRLAGNGAGLASVQFVDKTPQDFYTPVPSYLAEAQKQLSEYFAKERQEFDLDLDLKAGTPFQQAVWAHFRQIPYGKTSTYSAVAQVIDSKKSARAVGRAASLNPLLIVVPCHRIIGASGDLTGFASGVDVKRKLLALENSKSFGIQQSLF